MLPFIPHKTYLCTQSVTIGDKIQQFTFKHLSTITVSPFKIGVLGAGTMGTGIAQVAATAGCDVVVCDTNKPALVKAADTLQKTLLKAVEKGKMERSEAGAIFDRVKFVDYLGQFSDCNMVIEAIVEDLAVKQEAFRKIERSAGPNTILATNTSSLSVTALGAVLERPERLIGVHFFNPAPLMRLVEIIPALQTDPVTVQNARAWVGTWGKTTVLAKDTPGFIVNRVARPFYGEALRLYEEGIADIATIDWAMRTFGGFRMGPFELMDLIGHDVNYAVTESVFQNQYYDPRYKPSITQKRLVEAQFLGQKTQRGFYDYRPGAQRPEPKQEEILGQALADRVIAMLINEAADALHWNIATRDDLDLAMTTGVNYPKGLLAWADEIGIEKVVSRLDALYAEYLEDRYRCSPLLRRMAKENRTFYPEQL